MSSAVIVWAWLGGRTHLTSAARFVYVRSQDRLAPVCPPLAGLSTPGAGTNASISAVCADPATACRPGAWDDRFRGARVARSEEMVAGGTLSSLVRVRSNRSWSFLVDTPPPDARTRSVPKTVVPPPGVERPASGGHTGGSRSSVGRKRSG